MRIRPIATLVSVVALAAFATACEDPGAQDPAGKPPTTEQPDADTPPQEPERSEEGTEPEQEPEQEDESVDKDVDKEVDSELGKTLTLGESTPVTHTSGSTKTTLEVAAKSVKRGKLSDLEKVRLDGAEREMQPYYVTVDFKNVDGDNPKPNTLMTSVELRDDRGEKAKTVFTMEDDVTDCVNERPEDLSKGGTLSTCRVFLVAEGETPKVVAYRSDFKREPVFWNAGK